MRRAKRTLPRRVNGDLRLQFDDEKLTTFAGLELLLRHLRSTGFRQRLSEAFRRVRFRGDYAVPKMIFLLIAMMWIGGRRLRHVRFVSGDPMLLRFCGLSTLPDERTVSRWLGRFTRHSIRALAVVNEELVFGAIRRLKLRKLTVDVDGTVISTGMQVDRAVRGYNPHHRKVPSYFPILAHLAETGQVLSVRNRPGNFHDGTTGVPFLRDLISGIRRHVGRQVRVQMRMDGAFFQRPVLELLLGSKTDFAIKVPMHPWLGLKPIIQMRVRWDRVTDDVSGFETILPVSQWGLASASPATARGCSTGRPRTSSSTSSLLTMGRTSTRLSRPIWI